MLTAAEFLMHEPLPLHRIHDAILDFCRGRQDIVVFGAQAVNIYVSEPRMTQDVDLLSPAPAAVAAELVRTLQDAFHVALRVRELAAGRAYRVYQVRSEGNRHLADVRRADFPLDEAVEREGVRYLSLTFLTALKVVALSKRRLAPKGATDLADLRRLLIAHPELRAPDGPVGDAVRRVGGGQEALRTWEQLLTEPVVTDEETDEGY